MPPGLLEYIVTVHRTRVSADFDRDSDIMRRPGWFVGQASIESANARARSATVVRLVARVRLVRPRYNPTQPELQVPAQTNAPRSKFHPKLQRNKELQIILK